MRFSIKVNEKCVTVNNLPKQTQQIEQLTNLLSQLGQTQLDGHITYLIPTYNFPVINKLQYSIHVGRLRVIMTWHVFTRSPQFGRGKFFLVDAYQFAARIRLVNLACAKIALPTLQTKTQ